MNPATLRAELQSEDLAADRLGEFAAAAVMELGRGLAAPPKRASKEQRAAAARILRSIQATESTWSRLRDLAADPDYAGIGPLRAQAQPELVNTQAALLALDSLDERLLNRIAEVLPELVEASSEDERIVPPMATTTRHTAAPVTLADASEGDGVTSLPLAGLPVFGGGGALGPVGGYQPRMLIDAPGVVPEVGPLTLGGEAGLAFVTTGKGAPRPLRLFIEVLMAIPREARAQAGSSGYRLRVQVRELVAGLWPRGSGSRRSPWSATRHAGPLYDALEAVHGARVPYPMDDGRVAAWAPIAVRLWPPRDGMRLDDDVLFDVLLPPDEGRGPKVHIPTLRSYGLDSGPAYAGYLGVCWYWNEARRRNGYRPPPVDPDHRQFTRVYPPLEKQDLVALCYPRFVGAEGSAFRNALERSREVLAGQERDGLLRVVTRPDGVRLVPTNERRALPALIAGSTRRVRQA